MDHRDRLILALSTLLRAEREAREAWDAAIAADAIQPATLDALKADPIRVVTAEDLELAEAFVAPAPARSMTA